MLYTSGTTARPKGVVTTHRCIRAQIESLVAAWRWTAADRIPLFLPLQHVHGLVNVVSCALWAGASFTALGKFEPEAVIAAVAADEYTLFMAVPTNYVRLLEALEALDAASRTRAAAGFGRLRLVVSGSAALPASVFERFAALTGQPILERYGMTEIGMALSNPYDGPRRPGHVGLPLPGVEVRPWSDSHAGSPPPGEPGEIQVRGATVFSGYWAQPEATAAAFVDGWFRSGDVAVVEEGSYRILGRSSVDIIKSGGYKLSALEIEAALLDCPGVAECAVVGLPDDTWGEAVAAAVVLRPGAELSLESLRDWARARLSVYKLPRRLACVAALPRTAMGKVTKPAVRGLFSGG
jgi:malonyl-CoA/methylmalonyl-CoA synthetase